MPKRLTKADWGWIQAAMEFVDAGEWPWEKHGDDVDGRNMESFKRTLAKVNERASVSVLDDE